MGAERELLYYGPLGKYVDECTREELLDIVYLLASRERDHQRAMQARADLMRIKEERRERHRKWGWWLER